MNVVLQTILSLGISVCLVKMFELKSEKFYQPLDQILHDVNKKCVKMDEKDTKDFVQIAQKVVSVIIEKLKNNDAFKEMYSNTEYVGSYFDGLRVKEATEFDLNLIMKLPLNYDLIKVENNHVTCGFVKVNIEDAKNHPKYTGEIKKIIDKWCDGKGNLQQNKFREWMEGSISKALGMTQITEFIDGRYIQIQLRKSGPAFTLLIKDGSKRIDVDLVFTLRFNKQPPSPIRWNEQFSPTFVLVPKEINNNPNKNLFWRISFPDAEKKLMKDNNKLKYMNRLLKALRDAENYNIPSYFLKTVFLWEAHEMSLQPTKKVFWQKNAGYLYVYALDKLMTYLENQRLPYYWHKKMNLISPYNSANVKNIAGRLKNILTKINNLIEEKKYEKLRDYIFSIYRIFESLPVIDGLRVTDKSTDNNINLKQQDSCIIQ